jgi:O-antigen ligase
VQFDLAGRTAGTAYGGLGLVHQLVREFLQSRILHMYVTSGIILLTSWLLFGSHYRVASFNVLFHLLEGLCLVVMVRGLELSKKEYLNALTAFWLSGVVQGVLAIEQFFTQEVFASKWLGLSYQTAKNLGTGVVQFGEERWLRAYGSLGGPNPLGMFLAVVLLLGFAIYFTRAPLRKWKLYVFTLGQLIISTGLVLSFSRGAWLGAALGGVLLLVHVWRSYVPELRRVFLMIAGLCVGVILIWVGALWPLFFTRLSSQGALESRSLTTRAAQYHQWYEVVQSQYPPLLGIGPGAYTYQLHKLYPKLAVWNLLPVHNSFLLVLAEYGIFGFGLLFTLFAVFSKQIKKNNWLFVPVIAALLVSGLFEHFWWTLYAGQMAWWAVWALGLAVL